MQQSKAKTKPTPASGRVFVALAVIALLLAWLAWREFFSDSDWRRLSARFPASPQSGLYRQQRSVELRSGAGVAVSRYTVTLDWHESSVHLSQFAHVLGRRVDLAPIYPPMQIPAGAIRTCTVKRIGADAGVELSIADPPVRIGFAGYAESHDQGIVAWCRRAGIAMSFEPPE